MSEKAKRNKPSTKLIIVLIAICVCALLAIIILPQVFAPVESGDIEAPSPEATPDDNERQYVTSSDYPGNFLGEYYAEPGAFAIEQGVRTAMKDPKNEGSYFYVSINSSLPEAMTQGSTHDTYIYNGRSVSEWAMLNDLANEEYPYNEYNGDHGGNITKEEWLSAINEAKALDAQNNYEAAMEEFNKNFSQSARDKMNREWAESEALRLTKGGYDVFTTDSGALRGYLTIDQLNNFSTHPESFYIIGWVRSTGSIIDPK